APRGGWAGRSAPGTTRCRGGAACGCGGRHASGCAPAVPTTSDHGVTMTAPAPDRPLKIFYWAASMEDGTYIYRMQMPGDELRRLGHDVRVSTRFDAWGREEADIVIGQRICQTGPSWLWCKVAE